MRRTLALALLLIAAAAPAQVEYQPDGLFRDGWSERALAPGRWEVKGTSGAHEGGVAVALYRAAELAQADGASELRVVKQQVRTTTTRTRSSHAEIGYHERATVTMRAVHGPADRTACDMPNPGKCMTLSVAGVMARFGPVLGRAAPPGAVPVAIVTSPFSPADIARINAGSLAATALARSRETLPSWPPAPTARMGHPAPAPGPVPTATPTLAAVMPAQRIPHLAMSEAGLSPDEVLAVRLTAARPVHGREPTQGWTVSD